MQLLENPFISVALAQADPQEAAKIAKALRSGKDSAPGAQGATNVVPQASLDQLTSRFDVTRIPLARLEQMGSDPTIAFAEFFVKAMILQTRWMIKCSDPQVAAFVDQALREILPSFIAQYLKKHRFGYQGIIKRFEVRESLDWVYSDPLDETSPEKQVWPEGAIKPVVWKPFFAPAPTTVEPIWAKGTGDFEGIKYKPVAASESDKEQEFDVLHSLWVTNEKEKVHGSLWGFPRIGYAYRFWWSFWFNWGLADRHFEKDADPSAIVYYPSNRPDDAQGRSMRDIALGIGDQARSNSTIALPGELVVADDGTTKAMREWELTFAKGGGNFEVFAARFEQLRRFMLQACMVPEEAFQAKGGTAGYNSTGQQMDAFQMSQINVLAEMDHDLNRYVIPQIVAANFPEKQVKATKVTQGYNTNDIELAKLIIQGAANSDVTSLNLDMEAMLDAVGLPRLSPAAIAKKEAEAAAAAQQVTTPDPAEAVSGEAAGVNEQGLYYAPREVIKLSTHDEESRAVFMSELTAVAALRDPIVLADAQRIRNIWHTSLQYDLGIATTLLHDYKDNLALDEDFLERFYRRAKSRSYETALQTRRALMGIMRRGSTTEIEKAGLADFSWDPMYSEKASAFLAERADIMTESITKTTRDSVKAYLSELVAANTPHDEMSQLLSAHFRTMSSWRADRIVRTEIGRAYNMATLLAAEEAGIKQVQALDAQLGPERSDPHCIKRNGKIFTIQQAFAELEEEHPNGTLQFRLIRKPVKFKYLPVPEGAPAGALAQFEETDAEIIISLSEALSEEQGNDYTIKVIDRIETANRMALAEAA